MSARCLLGRAVSQIYPNQPSPKPTSCRMRLASSSLQQPIAAYSSLQQLLAASSSFQQPTHTPPLPAHHPCFNLAPPRMFGYPTGVGALLVRTSVAPLLRKAYWGGGAVALATAGGGGGEGTGVRVPHCRPSERLEDGTVRGVV